jgi:predicted RND superfamily exporter protein
LLAIIDRLQTLPEAEGQRVLAQFQQSLFRDFQDKWTLLRNNLNPSGPITLANIPPQLKSRFVSQDGTKFLLQIYPKNNIWNREPLEEFISQLRQVDADVTGSPVIGYESIDAMKKGYIEGGLYALFAIILIAFFSLRNIKDALLAMIPLGLGVVWTAGLMWLFHLKFNLANLIVVPLILGIGIENGIHLIHRYREEREGGARLITGSTGQAVTLFSLTTMIGFGSLMLATHRGVFTMGLLLTIAVGSVLVASLLVLPLLLFHPVRKAQAIRANIEAEEEEVSSNEQRVMSNK